MSIVYWIILAAIILFFLLRLRGGKGITSITAEQLKTLLEDKQNRKFIDVREPAEYKGGHVAGMKNIPLATVAKECANWDKNDEIIVMCRSGSRSMMAARTLKRQGFTKVINVRGGVMSWQGKLS